MAWSDNIDKKKKQKQDPLIIISTFSHSAPPNYRQCSLTIVFE
jgi:hypothetical protein